jgi:hypothetical protein
MDEMTDDTEDLEPIDVSAERPAATGTIAPGPGWQPGWYSDPWTAGQYRYWNGQAWTAETHRAGPAPAPGGWPAQPATTFGGNAGGLYRSDPLPGPEAAAYRRRRRTPAMVAAVVAIALVAGAIGYAIEASTESSKPAARSQVPSGTLPAGNTAPAPLTAALSKLVVRQADVGASHVVLLIPNGNRTTQPTLDLCNGTFASEKLRAARLQVAEVDASGNGLLSTEAVAYRNTAASAQAFAELRRVRSACPSTPVVSPVGEPTAVTSFKAAPDASWPRTRSVERLAYSFDTTASGTKSPSVAVYLRRGRFLLGVYFPRPGGAQAAVGGKTTIEGIVGGFEARLAQLPASVVNAK